MDSVRWWVVAAGLDVFLDRGDLFLPGTRRYQGTRFGVSSRHTWGGCSCRTFASPTTAPLSPFRTALEAHLGKGSRRVPELRKPPTRTGEGELEASGSSVNLVVGEGDGPPSGDTEAEEEATEAGGEHDVDAA